MAEEKPKHPFKRKISDIKDIVHSFYGGNSQKIIGFIESLKGIDSIENLFSQSKRTISIGNSNSLFSVNLEDLEAGSYQIEEDRYYTHLFPSDLIRALVNLAEVFVIKDPDLSEYTGGELSLVKEWGGYDSGEKTIDEAQYNNHYDDIQSLLNAVVKAYDSHSYLLSETNTIKKTLSDEDLEKILELIEKEDKEGDDSATKEDDAPPDLNQSVVTPPPATTPEPQTPPPTTSEKDILTPAQKQKIQYETAWMYNRAVYEMFTAYGIEAGDVSPDLLNKLRTDVYKFTVSMDPKDLALMFGSASKRQAALLKFYPQFSSENSAQIDSFYQEISQKPSYQELNDKQRDSFKKFHSDMVSDGAITLISPENHLRGSLKDILNSDSPVLNQNIQNTLDTMILRDGINQDFFTTDENGNVISAHASQNKHDVINAIDNISPEELVILFGLPSGTKISGADLKQLKKTLVSYTVQRASELTLHIQDTSLSQGMMSLSDEDAKKLEQGDSRMSADRRNFTTSIRSSIKQNGAKTVIGGMDEKRGSKRKEKLAKLAKEYKTFIPLWNILSAREQRAVYNKFGIAFDKNSDKDAKLGFVAEFLYFDVTSLGTIKKVGSIKDSISEKNKQAYQDLIELSGQLSREHEFSEFISEKYIFYSEYETTLALADHLLSGESLESFPTQELFYGYSPREIMNADSRIESSGYELSGSNRRFSRKRKGPKRFKKLRKALKKTKLYRKLKASKYLAKRKLRAAKKMVKALTDSAALAALKGVSAAANLVIPGLGSLIYAMGKKIGAKKTIAAIGAALAFIIAKTIQSLTTIGGSILGIAGGVGGWFLSGPLGVIPGFIVGANTGAAIFPTTWGSLFGQSSANAGAQASAINASANSAAASQASASQAISSSSGVFFGLPIFLLAPGLATAISIVATIYTVITIQSAFLIPLPPGLNGKYGSKGPLICTEATNNLSIVKEPNPGDNLSENPGGNTIANTAYKIVGKLEQGFWCYWNRHPEQPENFNEFEYQKYPNHCVYNNSTPENCGGNYMDIQTGDDLYWCTMLVNEAYGIGFSLQARTMAKEFDSTPGYAYKKIEDITWENIYPGDAIFFYTNESRTHIGHVAIVASSTQDFIISIDSNAYYKANSFTVGTDGKIQIGAISGTSVAGIGYKTSASRP